MIVRPVALWIAFLGSSLHWREWVAAAWFGPKGFASVIFGLWLLQAGVTEGRRMFYLIALVITGSIIAHSSTDVMVARWLRRRDEVRPPERMKVKS